MTDLLPRYATEQMRIDVDPMLEFTQPEILMQSIAKPTQAEVQAIPTATLGARSALRRGARRIVSVLGIAGVVGALVSSCGGGSDDATTERTALVAQGKQVFRFDTFGDETQWTDTLRMHEVIRTAVDPTTALSVGLKVDAEALPAAVVAGIQSGSVDLKSPATTVALLKLNAVVGIKGTVETVNGTDVLTRVGVTCALCHSTVDNSFAPGIGKRLDGWPNRDLNPGAIIALSPALSLAVKAVYNSWGPGMYDPRFNLDGKNGPQVIPPAYGLSGINKVTSTGDGDDLAYWNRYVGVTQMGGHGTFVEPRTGVNVTNGSDDLITTKLPALQAYQLSLAAPPPPSGSFDAAAADRGRTVFNNAARCATCHSGPEFTDANTRLHPPTDAVSEPEPVGVRSYASRSATKQYRTAPLKGLWQHAPYFHNGTAATLDAVVQTYNTKQSLGLSAGQMADLTQYLRSL
jgi:cytochrome c5/mono/diheme cytochrome c family protein